MNEKEKALQDIDLIKTMMDRTKEAIDPASPIIILWGIIVVICNFTTHFLLQNFMDEYIGYVWWGTTFVGAIISSIMGYRIGKRQYSTGINQYTSRRLALIWTILVPIGVVWSILGPMYDVFPVESLSILWALLYSIGIYITGIFYSKEFIYGGILIFIGSILAILINEYHSIIIGIFMGFGTIYPGVVANIRFKKFLRENNDE